MIFAPLALAACGSGGGQPRTSQFDPASGTSSPPPSGTPEAELALRSRDLQRPMLDASKFGILGARGQYVLGGPSGVGVGVGTVGGFIPVIFATVSYEGHLQKLPSDEARRAQILSDVKLTNAEAEAAIATMNTVIQRQESRVATARASGSAAEVQAATASSREIVQDIAMAKDGLEDRTREIGPPLRRYSPPGFNPEIDTEFAKLQENDKAVEEILVSTRNSSIFVQIDG
jgi:hypothetical protein